MVVRMRSTRSHTGNRRGHHKLSNPGLTKDNDGVHLRHRMNPMTGTYRGRKVLDLAAKALKKAKKAKAKEKETAR